MSLTVPADQLATIGRLALLDHDLFRSWQGCLRWKHLIGVLTDGLLAQRHSAASDLVLNHSVGIVDGVGK